MWTTNTIRKTEFARHVVKFHPEYKTIHLAPKNDTKVQQTNTGGKLWADPEGYTWWESEEELKKAQKIRSTQDNLHANNVKMIDPQNLATSKIPIAKMKLVEGEVNEKRKTYNAYSAPGSGGDRMQSIAYNPMCTITTRCQ